MPPRRPALDHAHQAAHRRRADPQVPPLVPGAGHDLRAGASAVMVDLPRQGARRLLLELPDDRRRPARRPRHPQPAVPPHPRPVGGFFSQPHHRAADVADHQRRQPGAAGGLGDDRRPDPRGAGADRLCRGDVLRRRAAGAGVRDRRAAGRLSAGPARAARAAQRPGASQEELEHLSHVTAEAFTGHRIVKAFGAEAREASRFRRRLAAALSHQPEVTSARRDAAAADGVPRRLRRSSALIWYGSTQIQQGAADAGGVPDRSSPPRS